jgi:hypothetical protein
MKPQTGSSLIALLVGLLISMIVVLAMMLVYRNTLQTVVVTSEGARSEGERVSGLLAAHMMLQDAGYGVSDLSINAMLVPLGGTPALNGSTLTGTALGIPANQARALVWTKGFDLDNNGEIETFRCEGLLADANGALLRLSSAANCGNASTQWNVIAWTATPLILDARLGFDGEQRTLTFSVNLLASGSECQPFGIGSGDINGPTGSLVVTLSYPLNVTGVSQTMQSSTCLVNM